MRQAVLSLFLAVVCSCSSNGASQAPEAPGDRRDGDPAGGGVTPVNPSMTGPRTDDVDGPPPSTPRASGHLRVMAANISSGSPPAYGAADGVRIFQGLRADVVLIQELNVGHDTKAELDAFVATTFGASFSYYREQGQGVQIPNGIISRYPITDSGSWSDPQVGNRGFAYAKLAIPGPHPLWAISLHLLTSGGTERAAEADAVVAKIKATVPASDYVILGGDFNTSSRTEPCITTLSNIVVTAAPYPVDRTGNDNTSLARKKPHDWLLAGHGFASLAVPTVFGEHSFPSGLVFDSRVYSPLAEVAPIQARDSDSVNTQHMPVVRDFQLAP